MTEEESSGTLVIFIVSPAVKISFGVVLPIISAEDCSVFYTEQSGWLRKDRYKKIIDKMSQPRSSDAKLL